MGRNYERIEPAVETWIGRQHLFFVATSPLSGDGHINLSPKAYDTFRVLGPGRVAYEDLTGSGAETIAHARENGRITLMWCAFEGPPRIVRVFGTASVKAADDPELAPAFNHTPGRRSFIDVAVDRVRDSCGYAVPFMGYTGERARLEEWAVGKTDQELRRYQIGNNTMSIDGLPALDAAI